MAGVQIDGVNNKIDFDDDLDTSISANTDDTLVIEAGGNTMATITATTLTINDGTTITTADNTDTLTLVSTDADAAVGPNLKLYRNSGSPADNDSLGQIFFVGRNDNSQDFTAFQMNAYSTDVSDGTEDGTFRMYAIQGGSQHIVMQITPTETVFNDGTVDQDFRVESNGNTHMLFVDGGNDVVGIGTSSPNFPLDVVSDSSANGIQLRGRSADNIAQFSFESNDSGTVYSQLQSLSSELKVKTIANIPMSFHTNSTERMRINAAGDVLINGTQEYNTLNGRGNLVVGSGSGNEGITIVSGSSNTAGIAFADGASGSEAYRGQIEYQHNNDAFAIYTAASERMRISSTGKVGINLANTGTAMLKIGIPNAQYGLETLPEVNQTYYAAIFRNSSGNDVGRIEAAASSTSFVTSSDYRLKENVSYDFDATTRLKQLKPSRFNFINTPDTTVDGFLAHEVSSIVPEAISGTKDATETKEKVVVNANGFVIEEGVEESNWTVGKSDILYTAEDKEVIDSHYNVGDIKTKAIYPADSTWAASKVFPVYQAIDQSKLVPLLVKTIQELEARITTLEG